MSPRPASPDVLAVDLGKSTCRVMLCRDGARHVVEGPGAPGLAAPGGVASAESAILSLALPLLGSSMIASMGVAAAGAATAPDAARALAERLCSSFRAARVLVASDAIAAHAGALGGAPGIVLAVGTGAVATVLGPNGETYCVDGLGPLLGDEGGGGWVGLAALRAVLRARDRRGPATTLTQAAEARFGTLDRLVAALNGSDNPARLAAAFAPDVDATGASGDAVAQAVLHQASDALAETLAAAAALLPPGTWPLAILGGWGIARPAPQLPQGNVRLLLQPPRGIALDGARMLAEGLAPMHTSGAVLVSGGRATNTLDLLATEAVRPGLETLDQLPPAELVRLVIEGERAATAAMHRALPALSAAAEAVAARMLAGGRLFTLGAGTPGRLAVLDAAELGPTFNAPPGLVIPLLAGGLDAMVNAAEGAEDDPDAAARALDTHGLIAGDAVVGIAASGRTPFVLGGLRHARARGALTIGIVNNPASPIAAASEIAVEILTGPELIAGSTRMTAGTAQKVALNALSTAAMVALGKTYGARMVDVRATNAKLRRRALRTVQEVAAVTEAEAEAALAATGGQLKPALLMLLAGIDAVTAAARLHASGGRVRAALAAN